MTECQDDAIVPILQFGIPDGGDEADLVLVKVCQVNQLDFGAERAQAVECASAEVGADANVLSEEQVLPQSPVGEHAPPVLRAVPPGDDDELGAAVI